jgi:protein SCO1/2
MAASLLGERSLLRRPLFWTVPAALLAAWPLAALIFGDPWSSPPPRLALVPVEEAGAPAYVVPPFEHVDHRGARFGSDQLEGRPWVASFFFTSCPTLCPKLTEQLVALEARLDAEESPVRMVTFTVDPETDTPEVLARHAREVGAGPRWTFLTGEPAALERTIVDGFKLPMGAPEAATGPAATMAIAHAVRFVLVDGERGVRGLYDADAEGIEALVRDAGRLAAGVER